MLWELLTELRAGGEQGNLLMWCTMQLMPKCRVGSILDAHVLFDEDPTRSGHLLRSETINKWSICVLKIHCCICQNPFSYHNNLQTCTSNHILPHNLETPEHITTIAALAFGCEANSELFLVHNLSCFIRIDKCIRKRNYCDILQYLFWSMSVTAPLRKPQFWL